MSCVCYRKYQEAAHKFSVAIKYNPAVEQYYENRAKAYSKASKLEEAKQDAIRVLILDPTNEQARMSHHRMYIQPHQIQYNYLHFT